MGSRKRKSAFRKRLELTSARTALKAAAWLAQTMPRSAILGLGSRLGALAWRVTPSRRRLAERNMARTFPDWSAERVRDTVKEAYRRQGIYLLEFLHLPAIPPERLTEIVAVRGERNAVPALRAGRGIIAITGHYGNFEVFAAVAARRGIQLTAIARDADDEETTSFVNGMRERMGYHILPRHKAARESFAVLRRGEVLGILCDQNDPTGVFVPFLGRLAGTTVGPASLALRTGAALLPCFIHREGARHIAEILPEITYEPTGDRNRDIVELTTIINSVVSDAILAHPEEWLWIHDRWRSAPPAPAAQQAAER